MKKLMVMVVAIVMAMTILVGSAYGESIKEIELKEVELEETIIEETMIVENETNSDIHEERVPNYVITIGGDRFIDIHVNKHFAWITAIGEGWKATKEFCVNAGNTVADTAVNAYESTVNWIGGLLDKK